MESGTIVRWLKNEGDAVTKREPLYELDTDKVTQEVEAEADGVLLKIVIADGEVDVGTTVAVIGAEGEEVSVEAPKPAGVEEEPEAEAVEEPEPKGEDKEEKEEKEQPEERAGQEGDDQPRDTVPRGDGSPE